MNVRLLAKATPKEDFWAPVHFQRRHVSSQARKMTRTHYDILQVPGEASQADIKSAYYRLSKLYHPDVSKTVGAEEKFSEISEAYEILGNVYKRKTYDREIHIEALISDRDSAQHGSTQSGARPFPMRGGFDLDWHIPPRRPGISNHETDPHELYTQQLYRNYYYYHCYSAEPKKDQDRAMYGEEAVREYDLDKYTTKARALVTAGLFFYIIIDFLFPTTDPAIKPTIYVSPARRFKLRKRDVSHRK